MTSRLMSSDSVAVDTRETRGFASEIKFVVARAVAERIREWARTHLEADEHGTGRWGDEYLVTSLYFDTDSLDVLRRRGSFGRAKYRIRRYGAERVVFLERKLRTNVLLVKRRTQANLHDLPLLHETADATLLPWVGCWFGRRLERRQLHPVCQVSYHRMARVGSNDLGSIRLTLDGGLDALPAAGLAFIAGPAHPVLESHAILELKYRQAMPAIFKRLVEEFSLSPGRVSKYRLAQATLGNVRPALDTPRRNRVAEPAWV